MAEPSAAPFRAPLPRSRRVWYRRLAHLWWTYQWPIIIALGLACLILGYLGFREYYGQYPAAKAHSIGDLIYYTAQLVPMISGGLDHPVPWELDVARHLLPLVVGYAGIAAIIVLLSEPLRRLRLRRARGHVVVAGLGRKGLLLTRRFRALGLPVVIIERDAANRSIEQCRDEGVMVLVGDAGDAHLLRAAGVARAAYLVSVCGDDGANVDVAFSARDLTRSRRGPALACAVHIGDPNLRALLQAREFEAEATRGFRLELFSVFELGARVMLDEHPVTGIGAGTLRNSEVRAHIVVLGAGLFGQSLILQAAREWLALPPVSADQCLRVTVIDRQASARVGALRARYPHLGEACDLRPRDMDVDSEEFYRADYANPDEEDGERGDGNRERGLDGVTAVYICLDNDSVALSAALSMLNALRGACVPIAVRLGAESGLATFVDDAGRVSADNARLYAFPLLERTCTPDLVLGGTHERLARTMHEEYCRRQAESGQTAATNPSLRPWDELPPELMEANRRQADHVGTKLASAGCGLAPLNDWDADRLAFTEAEVERLAELEHERWVSDHLVDGWRYRPGAKDPEQRTHPDLVPWAELPVSEKEKDRDVVRELPALLARAGLQICRAGGGARSAPPPAPREPSRAAF